MRMNLGGCENGVVKLFRATLENFVIESRMVLARSP